MMSQVVRRLVWMGVAFGGAGAWADSAPWVSKEWTYRQVVDLEPVTTKYQGDDVGVVRFPTYGLMDAGSPNVWVVSRGSKKTCSHFIMGVGPGDWITVAFALSGGSKRYYVYFNDKAAPAPKDPAKQWRPQRGVLLEARRHRGGGAVGFQQAKKTFQRAAPLLGRTFVPNIFIAHNPFGPPGNTCYRYTGHLIIPNNVTRPMAISSRDASFLVIDGELVVQWPGTHAWTGDAKHAKEVTLTKGEHKLEFYHIHVAPEEGAVVAWQKPGAKAFEAVPPSAFSPIAHGTPKELERPGQGGRRVVAAAFRADWAGETFFANRYTFRYHFESRLPKGQRRAAALLWDLGDGTTSDQPAFDHVYLQPGTYPVTVTVKQGGKEQKLTNRIAVNRNWTRVADPTLDPVADHAKIVAGYAFRAMPVEHLSVAMVLQNRAGNESAKLAIASVIVDSHAEADDGAMVAAAELMEESLLGQPDGPGKAAKAWGRVQARAKQRDTRAKASMQIGLIELNYLGHQKAAKKRFDGILKNPPGDKRTLRAVRISLGDALMELGDAEGARAAYRAAGTERPLSKYNLYIPPKIRMIEDFLRRKELDAVEEHLRQWEWEFPENRLAGYSALLWVRLHQARGEHEAAIRKAKRVVRANRLSHYAADLLMSAYESHVKLGQKDAARQCLKQIVDDHRESPCWPKAKQLYGS